MTTAAACAARIDTNMERGGRPLQNYPSKKTDQISWNEWKPSGEAAAADTPCSNKIRMLFGPIWLD